MKRSWSRAIVAIIIAAALAGCASSATKAGTVTPNASSATTPTEVRATDVARADPGSVSTAALVDGINAFGHDLYARAATGGNVVVSPLSIEVALSMARAGAGGTTAAEIDAAMHFPSTGRDAQMNALIRDLATQDTAPPVQSPAASRDPNAPPAAPILTIANALFVQQGQPIGQAFLKTMAADYGSGVRTVDFTSPSAIAQINAWVRTQTADRIQQLFDSLDPSTKLVLANAVYLKADWATPFAQQPTSDATFTTAAGKQITVPTMHQNGSLGYASSDQWQAVALPYAGGTLTMYVIVPTANTSLADLLAPATLTQISDGLRPTSLSLALPRWKSTTKLNLAPALKSLGIRAAFTPAADFAGIAPELYIGKAIHRATIDVDEWGTEAAAVTGLAFPAAGAMTPELTVRADHPFAYAIVNPQTGVVVFEGSVADPTAGSADDGSQARAAISSESQSARPPTTASPSAARQAAIPESVKAACGHPGAQAVLTAVPITVPRAQCDLTGVEVRYGPTGVTVPREGGVQADLDGISSSVEFGANVDPTTGDVTFS